MSGTVLSASAKGATFLILLQIGSRALTFVVNQVLLRFLSPELLGVSAQLELYSISVLYFARESLRVALQRQASSVQAVVNLSYLAIFLGAPLAYALAGLWASSDVPTVAYFHQSLWLYAGATVLELCTEPAFVSCQQLMLYKIRASAETTATILRCFSTCGFAIWASYGGRDPGASPFAVGQLAYALALLSIYTFRVAPVARKENFSLILRSVGESKPDEYILSRFSRPLSKLSLSIFLQSSIKYILTQGDSILITSLASLRDQGAYALAGNYGGLIARMLFQPIEESSRNLLAKLCSPSQPSQKPAKEGIRQAKEFLQNIIHFYNLISLAACALGPTLAPMLLRIVAGSKWADTEAGEVLATYCYYIPLLALNGVTEAFVASVATSAELHTQSIYMFAFFAGFGGSAYLFLGVLELGAQGLVYANCVNMLLRIIFNLAFIKGFFGRNKESFDYLATLPNGASVAVAVAAPAFLKATAGALPSKYGRVGELIWAGGTAAVFGGCILLFEHKYLMQCYQMLRPKKGAAPETEENPQSTDGEKKRT